MRRRNLSILLVVVVLTGCGGHAKRAARPVQPKLSRALAARLAAQSDGVTARLAAGDSCGARTAALALQQQTIAAINARRVPGPLLEPLQGTVNDLVDRIVCLPTAPAKPEKEKHRDEDHGGHGHGDHGGEGKG
jgi:hypothetical protein